MNASQYVTVGDKLYTAQPDGTLVPVDTGIVVNGVTYHENADGHLVPAGAIPVAQEAPKTRGRKTTEAVAFVPNQTVEQSNPRRRKTHAAASPQASSARTPRAKADTWTVKESWKGAEPTGGILWRARSCNIPAGKILKADKFELSMLIGAAMVKSGEYKAVKIV